MIIIVLSLLKLYKIIQIKYSIFDDYIDDKIIGITMQSSISSVVATCISSRSSRSSRPNPEFRMVPHPAPDLGWSIMRLKQ